MSMGADFESQPRVFLDGPKVLQEKSVGSSTVGTKLFIVKKQDSPAKGSASRSGEAALCPLK